jgi:outer membrane protein assembly factor BamB
MVLSLLLGGCAVTYVPTYKKGIIAQQAVNKPAHRWVYPTYEKLKKVPPRAGLQGAEKPTPLPAFVPDREPAFVLNMTLLSDGSIVCVSPLEYAYEAKKFTIATYHRERITQVKVNRFDGESGALQWSRALPAEGVYDITEMPSILLFSAKNFDKTGEFIETLLVSLDKESGTVRWTRKLMQPFRYFSISPEHNLIVFSTKSKEGTSDAETVEAIDADSGQTRWAVRLAPKGADTAKRNAWPVMVGNDIMLFDGGVSRLRLADGSVKWSREDIETMGFAQPLVIGDTAWFQSNKGITALDLGHGKTKWVADTEPGQLMKIVSSEKYLFASVSPDGPLAVDRKLAMIDLLSGNVHWQIETSSLMGNIVADDRSVHYTTITHLVSRRLADGSKVRSSELPWEDEFSHHGLTLRRDTLTIKNEWNVAAWKSTDHTPVYHHAFEPLCPIMTTRDRMLEQKKLGAAVTSATVNAASYNYFVNTAYFSSQFNSAMNSYRSTGNTSYLYSAQASYGMTQNAMAQNRALAGMQAGLMLSSTTLQLGTVVIKKKVQVTSSMVYPAIDAVLKKQRIFDNGDYVVRLVGVQHGNQRFSALKIIHEPTGQSKQVLLSPSQMPAKLTTFARSPMTAQELNGYYSAAMYLGHSYNTVVDLKRGCIFHYGPGLSVGEYVTYGDTGFLRGRLWRLEIP